VQRSRGEQRQFAEAPLTLWRYTNLFIIIIIFYTPGSIDPGVKNYKLKANITGGRTATESFVGRASFGMYWRASQQS